MKWFLPAAVLVFSAITGVQCSFGLNITAPLLSTPIIQSVGNGINVLVKANGTLKAAAEVDTSGVVVVLFQIANNVTKPMNQLLGAILTAASARKVNVPELFGNVSVLLTNTSSAIGNASAVVCDLQGLTKAYLYEGLSGNLTLLSDSMNNLTSGWNNLSIAAKNAANSPYPVTLLNITSFINASHVGNVSTPLKAVQTYITNIAAFITTIGTERTLAINYQAQVNTTVNNAIRSVANAEVNFNRTIADVFQRISQLQANTFKSINQTYAPVYVRVDSYNNGNVTNMTQFLADMVHANASLTEFIELSSNYSTEQIYGVLRDQIALLSGTLHNITANITNQGVTSTSQYATQCTQRYVKQLTDLSIGKLSSCLSSESNSFRPTIQFVQFQLELAKSAATPLFTQITKICQKPTGSCAANLFAVFPDHSQRVQNKISVIAGGVSNDEHIVTGRIRDCITANTAELIESAQTIQSKFGSCLSTGS